MMIVLIGTNDRRWYLHQELVKKAKSGYNVIFFFQLSFLIHLSNSSYPMIFLGGPITPLSPDGALSEPQSSQKCHLDNQIWLSCLFHS